MLYQVINYQYVSVSFAIIVGVALQSTIICHMGYWEPLNVIRNVSNIEYLNLHTSFCSFNATLMVWTKVIDTCW